MEWLDFFIGCCAGSLFGIVFCSWLKKRCQREINREIEISLRKEMAQLRAMKDKG